MPLNIIMYHLI